MVRSSACKRVSRRSIRHVSFLMRFCYPFKALLDKWIIIVCGITYCVCCHDPIYSIRSGLRSTPYFRYMWARTTSRGHDKQEQGNKVLLFFFSGLLFAVTVCRRPIYSCILDAILRPVSAVGIISMVG